jgi:acyl-coenzyme A synthetase/AMP-(fatty) acid ligase
MNFVQTFRKRSESQPGVPALIDHCFSGDRVLSYSSLNRLADYLSLELREQEIKPGDRILLALDPGQELYGYLLAALQVGAVPILYEQDGSHKEFAAWVKALQPSAYAVKREKWVGCQLDGAFKAIPKKFFVGTVRSQSRWLRLGKLGAVEDREPDSVALISLGADDAGKLSVRYWSQKQLDLNIQLLLARLKLKPGEIDLCQTPMQFIANLAAGLTSVICQESGLLPLRRVERRVEKFKPTRVAAETSLVRRLLRKYSSPLHKVFITDAPLDPESIEYFNSHAQHANIELLFCSELPLASLSLRGYERKGNARLVGNFFAEIEAEIVPEGAIDEAKAGENISPGPTKILGQLVIRSGILPGRENEPTDELDEKLNQRVSNGIWHFTGVRGYIDEQERFWLVENEDAESGQEEGGKSE